MKDYGGYSGNANEILDNGVRFIYTPSVQNLPVSAYGLLISFNSYHPVLSATYHCQLYITVSANVYVRFNQQTDYTSWDEWKQITTTAL